MNEDQIAALDVKGLRTLLANARKMSGDKTVQVARIAELELERREATKTKRSSRATPWKKFGGTYAHAGDVHEYVVDGVVLARIEMLTQHSGATRDVYEAFVEGRQLGLFEHIEATRKAVEAELKKLGLVGAG